MTATEFDRLTAELDARVKPWLREGDHWRSGPDGLPLFQDTLVAYCRVANLVRLGSGRPDGEFRLTLLGWTVTIANDSLASDSFHRDFQAFSGGSPEEAVARMLKDALARACPQCRCWDAHDERCSREGAE